MKNVEAVKMARVRKAESRGPSPRPAKTPEGRENQMIALAMDVAEKQMRDGTASAQVITHFLKLGSTKETLEKEMLAKRTALLSAKTESLESARRVEELYENALEAMRIYSGESYE